MKLDDQTRAILGDVIEMAREGRSPKQISEKVGASKSFVDRMLRNLPKLVGQMLTEPA